jgi:hypothetical protein
LTIQPEAHGHGKILGGGMVGTHAGDMIGEIALAIEMGADAVDIGKTIHPHPTLGESIGMAAEVAHGSCTDLPPNLTSDGFTAPPPAGVGSCPSSGSRGTARSIAGLRSHTPRSGSA